MPHLQRHARLIAILGLGVALAASTLLAVHTAFNMPVPGCGAGRDCESLAASVWGTLPFARVPISIVGCAALAGMMLALLLSSPSRGVPRLLAFATAAISLALLVVMVVFNRFCTLCIVTHAGVLVFAVANSVACRGASSPPARAHVWVLAAALAIATLSVLSLEWKHTQTQADQARAEDLAASTARITQAPRSQVQGFRGRYLLGPDPAPVRIVVFTDFQCPQCAQVERELISLQASTPGVQLSLKHFPLCADCNRGATVTLHPNACNTAVAVEAAGVAGGPTAFWNAAAWAFEHQGTFTTSDFLSSSAGWGVVTDRLSAARNDPSTLDAIRADVDDGLRLGVARTPAIYINGVELRGWESPGAIAQAVHAVLTALPATAGSDVPPTAHEKILQDWLAAAPNPAVSRSQAPPTDSPVRIVIFGDYQDAGTEQADAILRDYAATWPSTAYEFRHFPASSTCNPRLSINPHPMACKMARSAEAARVLGGQPAFDRMHAWLFAHRQDYSDAGLRVLALELQIDAGVLIAANKDARVTAALEADIAAGNALAITAIPAIYINERPVSVWKTDAGEVLTKILDRAALDEQAAHPATSR